MSPTKGRPEPTGDDGQGDSGGDQGPVKQRRRRRGIQVDSYVVKADLRPVEIGERPPKSWRQVARDVNTALMAITVYTFRGVEDLLLSGRKFVRGLGEIPGAVARRVDRAHDRADRREAVRQEKFTENRLPKPDTAAVVAQLEALFGELRDEGVVVEPHDLGDGRTGILIVPPGVREDALRLAQAALPSPVGAGPAGLSVETILPARIAKVLVRAGVRTVDDLTARTAAELLDINGLGEQSLVKVRTALHRLGLSFRVVEITLEAELKAQASMAAFGVIGTPAMPVVVRQQKPNPSLLSGSVVVDPLIPPPSGPTELGG